jgi:subtilisin family serine protease
MLPKSGSYGFLLELNTTPTLATYNAVAPQGLPAATAAAKAQFRQIQTDQDQVAAAVAKAAPGSRELYRTHSVLSGVAVYTDVHNLSKLQSIGGVKAVYPITPKSPSTSHAIPLVHAPQAWTAHGDLGQNTTIAIIDSGIDYTHADFGGPGTVAAYNTAHAHEAQPADPTLFPNAKIIGGYDFVGDGYNPDPGTPNFNPVPAPDPNPLDCSGHGTQVAGIAAGYGVTGAGQTFAGPYNTSTPFSSLNIGPGMAPRASLYAYRIFGCNGGTNLVTEAIDRAADPNGDGVPSDHVDVINLSLGARFASPQDADAVAANAATDLGITVVAAAGNEGDYYDVGGSPANAVKAISVVNSTDDMSTIDSLIVTAPASIAGKYGALRSANYDWFSLPDLSGQLAALSDPTNKDGCDPLSASDAALVNGKVAFMEWTDNNAVRRCGSVLRSGNVAAAGAVGFVFADDQAAPAGLISGSSVIPGVMVVKSAGDTLRAALGQGVVVGGTSPVDFPIVIPGNIDTLNPFSSRGIGGNGNVKPDVAAVGTNVTSAAVGTGSGRISEDGTSLASPMVAGLAALVRSEHPSWSPLDVKADIMNTAGQDLYNGFNHTGLRFAPNRAGAGRIQADTALDNQVLAYVVNDPGAVSVSFGPVEVAGPTKLTKTVRVVNKGLSSATFNLSY